MSEYDTEEYISKVMALENCTREQALDLISEFKEIDNSKIKIPKALKPKRSPADRYRKKYLKVLSEKRCTRCGKQDERTLAGYTQCDKCRQEVKRRKNEVKHL
jgi:hypothetical protein